MHTPQRKRLPATRPSVTRKAEICGFEVYITVGFFDDGTVQPDQNKLGEVFVKISKHGTELSGLMDTAATFLSIALQYGVPWPVLLGKMRYTRFGQPDERFSSLCDGIGAHIEEIINDRAELLGTD